MPKQGDSAKTKDLNGNQSILLSNPFHTSPCTHFNGFILPECSKKFSIRRPYQRSHFTLYGLHRSENVSLMEAWGWYTEISREREKGRKNPCHKPLKGRFFFLIVKIIFQIDSVLLSSRHAQETLGLPNCGKLYFLLFSLFNNFWINDSIFVA